MQHRGSTKGSMPNRSPQSSTLPFTGKRSVKYRVLSRSTSDMDAQEKALNKFAGFGYRLFGQKVVGERVQFTFVRKTRRQAPATAL
jgi:hypothetical protein